MGSSCSCSYSYGRGPAIGPHTGERCWPLLAVLWCYRTPDATVVCRGGGANLYRGWNSRVGWYCDDEPLCGECGEAKLIVSVSLGTLHSSNGRGKSCPDIEADLCCLGHGDILVIDGQCQDKFLHCTDPGLEQERINVTFRWIKQDSSGMLFANVCTGFISFCYGIVGNGVFWGFLVTP